VKRRRTQAVGAANLGVLTYAGFAAAGVFWLGGCGGDAFTAGGDAAPEASSPIVDAGPEAGTHDAAVDAGPAWCATHGASHTACEDFAAGVPDQLVEVALNGAISADTTDFESPPQSMLTSIPMLAKGASGTALASFSLAKIAGTQVVVSSYFNVASTCFLMTGSQSAISILAIDFADANYEVVIQVLPSSISLVEIATDADGGNPRMQEQSVQATGLLGGWQNWSLTLDGSAPRSATLTVGNATLFNKATLKSAPLLAVLQHPTVLLGVAGKNDGSDVTQACKVGVDDILIDVASAAVAN
jgi:hypothetical protein